MVGKKVPSAEAEGTIVLVEVNYFRDSSTATARSTVIPTMGLLPAPRKPIISTSKPPKGGFCVAAQRVLHILFQCGKHVTEEWWHEHSTKKLQLCQDQKRSNLNKSEQRRISYSKTITFDNFATL